MDPRAGRIAVVAVASTCLVALSGCHEVLRATFGKPDPPVHNPTSAGYRTAVVSKSAGRAFTGHADGDLAGRAVIKHGFVKSTMKNVRFIGDFSATLTGPPQPGDDRLGLLESSRWHGQFNVVHNRATGKITITGMLLATFTDASAGRACLQIAYHNAKARKRHRKANRNKGVSTIKVLGGEGGARTLAGTATVKVTAQTDGSMRLSGRVSAKTGPPRGFTPACTKLEQKFGLQPLPNG
jgi:hypothetical protein